MTLAFIVDGHMEKRIVQRMCADAPVKMTNLNGRDVEIQAIVKAVGSLLNLLRGRYYPVVIVIDREQRHSSSFNIEREITRSLALLGHDVKTLIVSSPDRMMENWTIAGKPWCKSGTCLLSEADTPCDGTHGKNLIKSLLRKHGLPYSETGNGVDMFCGMSVIEARKNSPSFARLFDEVRNYCVKWRLA